MLIHDPAVKKAVLQAMADECSLTILKLSKVKARSAMEIVRGSTLPSSSVYRRINELVACGLLKVERIVVTDEGKKFSLYRSTVREMRAEYSASSELEVDVSFDLDVVDKLSRLWISIRAEK